MKFLGILVVLLVIIAGAFLVWMKSAERVGIVPPIPAETKEPIPSPASPTVTPGGPTEEISPSPTEDVTGEETPISTPGEEPTFVPAPPTPTPESTPSLIPPGIRVVRFNDPVVGDPLASLDVPIGTTIYAPLTGTLWVSYVLDSDAVPQETYVHIYIEGEDGTLAYLGPGKLNVDIELHVDVTGESPGKVSKGDPLFTVVGGGPSSWVFVWRAMGYAVEPFQILYGWKLPSGRVISPDDLKVRRLFEGRSS